MYWVVKFFSNGEAHRSAAMEVFIVALFTLIPSTITYATKLSTSEEMAQSGERALLSSGELFLLGYAIFGTIFWLSFVRWDKTVHGARKFLGTLALVAVLFVVGLMGFDPTLNSRLAPDVKEWGLTFYIFINMIYYLLLFYINIDPPSPADVFDREAKGMAESYRRRQKK